jgi:hypothetical protein
LYLQSSVLALSLPPSADGLPSSLPFLVVYKHLTVFHNKEIKKKETNIQKSQIYLQPPSDDRGK